ncbi:MAG: Mov34/MPN/PAD-1 family protein [Planctomycetota bacterium]
MATKGVDEQKQSATSTGGRKAAEAQGEPVTDSTELLCQTFGISDPDRVKRFLGNGLFDSIWLGVDELAEHYSPAEIRRIMAAQSLVRTLARVRLGSAPPANGEALVPDLFLAHSDPHLDVVGALYYTNDGVPLADRVLFRGHLTEPWISMHQLAAPAVALNAQQVVVFLLRPAGYAETDAARRFSFRAISLLARRGGGRRAGDCRPLIRLITAVVAAGPQQWRAPGDRGGVRIWVRVRSPEPDRGPRWHPEGEEEIRWALGVLLAGDGESRGGLGWADDLIAACGGIAGLAFSRPQDLPPAGIPAESLRRVAGVIELARRLAVATVPRRPRATNGFPLYGYLSEKYRHEPGELGLVLMLDRNHRVVGEYRLYGANDSAAERRLRASPGHFMPQAIAARAAILLPVTLGPLIAETEKRRELWFHEADGRLHVDLDRPVDHRALDDQTWLAPAYGGAPGPRRRLRQYNRRSLEAFLPLDNPRKPRPGAPVRDPLHPPLRS